MSSKEVLKQLAEYTKLNIEKKPKRGRNAFDILFGFKNYGAGKTITRNVWKKYYQKPGQCDCFWIVTRVRHKTRGPYSNRGKLWGILTWKGKLYHNGEERRIKATQKRGWRLVPDEEVFDLQKYPTLSKEMTEEEYLRQLKEKEEEEN